MSLMRQTWRALIKDSVDAPVYKSVDRLFKSTVTDAELIAMASSISDMVLSGSLPDAEFREGAFWHLVDYFLPADISELWDPTDLQQLLLLLRFPKRYSLIEVKEDFDPFWEKQEALRSIDFTVEHKYITRLMASYIYEWCSHYSIEPDRWKLPNGASLECKRDATVVSKMKAWLEYEPTALSVPVPVLIKQRARHVNFANKMTSVPKNYKSRRNIGIESIELTCLSTPIAEALTRCLPPFVSVDDQDRNQTLALDASITGQLATIDLHAASDSVACGLCREVFPPHIYTDMLHVTSIAPLNRCQSWQDSEGIHYKVRHQKMRDTSCVWPATFYQKAGYSVIATMGNRITFPVEEMIFSAAIAASYCLCGADWHEFVDQTAVFGDDLIVPIWLVDTLVDVLSAIGFEVNQEKSFTSTSFRYRESCGCEFLDGADVASLYWPRNWNGEDIIPIIQLQHRLWEYPAASQVLSDWICQRHKHMTLARPGSVHQDLWDKYPNTKRVHGAYDMTRGSGEPEEILSCELHTVPSIRYSGDIRQEDLAIAEAILYDSFLRKSISESSVNDTFVHPDERIRSLFEESVTVTPRSLASRPELVLVQKKILI